MAQVKTRKEPVSNERNPDFKAEAVKIRKFVDTTIKNGKAKAFLIDHGFITNDGQITKRYGG